jgi:hypothetical protein
MTLPTDRDARNAIPLWDGLFSYFPDVWAEIAKASVLGNKQHNLGAKLFWNREVSTDHLNKVMRHCFDHGTGNVMDTDGTFHMAKAIWRACAELQLAIEACGVETARSPNAGNVTLTRETFVEFEASTDAESVGKALTPSMPLTREERVTYAQLAQDAAAKKRAESY